MADHFGRSAMTLITCDKGGSHQAQNITAVCLNPLCREDCLCCTICKSTKHSGHQMMALKILLDDVEFKAKRLEKKNELVVLGEIEETCSTCTQAIQNIQRYVSAKLQKIESKMMNFLGSAKSELQNSQKSKCNWSSEIEKLRFESDKQNLMNKIIDILGNVTLKEGKVEKINEEFFGSKNTEQVMAFRSSLIETLKNIHQGISHQYQKMYNPLFQPQHLRKNNFSNEFVVSSFSTKSNFNQLSSKLISNLNSNGNLDGVSLSSKDHVQYNNTLQSSTQQSQYYNSQKEIFKEQVQEKVNYSPVKSPSYSVQSLNHKLQVPDLTQMQLDSLELQRQIEQQQIILQNLTQSKQETTYIPQNNANQPPLFFEEAKNGIARIISPSPPSRLKYYSSLFSSNIPQKQSSIGSVFHKNQKSQIVQSNDVPVFLNNSFCGSPNNEFEQNSQTSEKKPFFGTQENNDYFSEEIFLPNDFQNKKMKDLPKSSERQLSFYFSKDLKHVSIECLEGQTKIKGGTQNEESRLALAMPSLETKPSVELHWAFKILNSKSMAYSNPLAVGICLNRFNESHNFKFQGEDTTNFLKGSSFRGSSLKSSAFITSQKDQLSTLSSKIDSSNHGCYLLTSSGFIRNHSDSSQDMKRVSVRFNQGDTLLCHFNPFRKYLKIKNKTSGEFCMINIEFTKGDTLYPCVRLSYCQDLVEILLSEE